MSLMGKSVHLDQNGPLIDDNGLITAVEMAHSSKSSNMPAPRFHGVPMDDRGSISSVDIVIQLMNWGIYRINFQEITQKRTNAWTGAWLKYKTQAVRLPTGFLGDCAIVRRETKCICYI